jgi:hypothetical protein
MGNLQPQHLLPYVHSQNLDNSETLFHICTRGVVSCRRFLISLWVIWQKVIAIFL